MDMNTGNMSHPPIGELDHLVVDAGALIRGEQIHGKAASYWTVKEILIEIRDKRARAGLQALPFELKVREPSEEAIKAIVDFAKKTGDLAVLSKPDIRLMALTYMLHKETHGLSNIRSEPLKPGQSTEEEEEASGLDENEGGHSIVEDDNASEPSSPKVDVKSLGVKKPGISWAQALRPEPKKSLPVESPSSSMWDDDDFAGIPAEEKQDSQPQEEWPSLETLKSETALERERFLQQREEVEEETKVLAQIEAKKREKREEKVRKKKQVEPEETKPEASLAAKVPITRSRILGTSGIVVDSGELEGEGWVTPGNIVDTNTFPGLQGRKAPVKSKTADAKVACITTDYAMQNVMMQMQLRLMTIAGRAVENVRRFILKCDSCYTLCRNLEKKFCPGCGNPTLARLSYSISPDGVLRYHYKKNRKVNTRGMRYSIPKPAGGRTGDLLLAEDQLLTGWWAQQAKKKTSSTSMFGEHVTESLGMNLKQRGDGIRIGYGRQNPNAAKGRERRGKKKKRSQKRPGYL